MRFSCPSCGASYRIPDETLLKAQASNGLRTRCNACGARLILGARKESALGNPTTAAGRKTPSPSPSSKFRGVFPTVFSLSKGVKKEKDLTAGFFLILILSLGLGAGYFALSRLDAFPFRAWVQSLPDLKDRFPVPRIIRDFAGKKNIPFVRKGDVSTRRLVRKGYELYLKERLDPALEAFDQAIETDPKNAEAHYWKGRTLLKMGKDEPAREAFEKALALRPDYWEALDNMAWLHMRRGAYSESLSCLNRSVELKPDNAWAYYNRGFLHAKTGNPELGLKDAEKACQLGYQKGCRMVESYGRSEGSATSSGD